MHMVMFFRIASINLFSVSFASFIHPFNKSSTYSVSDTVPDAGNIAVNLKEKNFCLHGAYFLMGK